MLSSIKKLYPPIFIALMHRNFKFSIFNTENSTYPAQRSLEMTSFVKMQFQYSRKLRRKVKVWSISLICNQNKTRDTWQSNREISIFNKSSAVTQKKINWKVCRITKSVHGIWRTHVPGFFSYFGPFYFLCLLQVFLEYCATAWLT